MLTRLANTLDRSVVRLTAFSIVGVFLLCSSGCTSVRDYVNNGFKVGPNYQKPPAPVADEWIDSKSKGVNVAAKDLSNGGLSSTIRS